MGYNNKSYSVIINGYLYFVINWNYSYLYCFTIVNYLLYYWYLYI